MKTAAVLALCILTLGFARPSLAQIGYSPAKPARYFNITLDLRFGAAPSQQPVTQTITTEVAVRDGRPGSCKVRMTSQMPVGAGSHTRFIDLGTKLDCNDVHMEDNALALQFLLDASRVKGMVKTTTPEGAAFDEPLITQRTLELTVRLPLNKTVVVFDSSTHAPPTQPLTKLKTNSAGLPSADPDVTQAAQDVPLVIEMTATEIP